MKKLLLILFGLSFRILYAQQLYVEITDTVETAYHIYYDGFEQNGFHYTYNKEVKDSIGVDSVRITRMYYLEGLVYDTLYYYDNMYSEEPAYKYRVARLPEKNYKKVYLQYEEIHYPNGRTGIDNRFTYY